MTKQVRIKQLQHGFGTSEIEIYQLKFGHKQTNPICCGKRTYRASIHPSHTTICIGYFCRKCERFYKLNGEQTQ